VTEDVTQLTWNDYDPDGTRITVLNVRDDANHGAVQTTSVDGKIRSITYIPNAGFQGEDSFTYVIVDDGGVEAVGRVIVQVVPGQQETPPSAP
jgi:hypothetical protein